LESYNGKELPEIEEGNGESKDEEEFAEEKYTDNKGS
jgi:hypothetical protein